MLSTDEMIIQKDERLSCVDLYTPVDTFQDDVLEGLRKSPKRFSPKYFYDERGSELFERITEQPEYYVTQTEIEIMKQSVGDICGQFAPAVTLVELGSGSSVKTRSLLEEMLRQGIRTHYVPVDISGDFLFKTAEDIRNRFPDITVEAVCGDFMKGVEWVGQKQRSESDQTIVYFPGSTIGNFSRPDAFDLMDRINSELRSGDGFVLGTDLIKDRAVLEAAYNDAGGVTAAFNLNILHRINSELGADIPVESYKHVAFFNAEQARVEMHLEAQREHTIHLASQSFDVKRGERIQTEDSHKYTLDGVRVLAEQTGYRLVKTWSDSRRYFGVHLLKVR